MKQARMVRPRPSASVAALAPLERRGGCGTCHGVTLFRPNIALDLPGFGTSETNGLAHNDVVKQAREFPSPIRALPTYMAPKVTASAVRSVRKRKVLVLMKKTQKFEE